MLGLALALVPPLLFVRHTTPVYVQYQLTALPAFCLGVGALAGMGWWQVRPPSASARLSWLRRAWGPAITLLALGVALVQATALGQGIQTMLQRATPGGLGTPLYYPRAAAQALRAEAGVQDGAEIIVLAPGDDPAFIADAAIYEVLLWDTPHRIVDGRSVLLVPGEAEARAVLLAVFPDMAALDEARAAGLVATERPLPRRTSEPPYIAWRAAGTPQSYQTVTPQALANGAVLMGWRIRRVGDMLRLSTWWQLTGPLTLGDYHQFNHLYSADGQTQLEVQDRPLSAHAWRAGDTLITWADFALPTQQGALWFDVGMYAWPSLQRVAVQGAADPNASIRLGTVEPWD